MLDLSRVKLHLRLDGDEEDSIIIGYIEAAKAHVAMHCDRVLVEGDPAGPEEMGMTPDVEQAILLLVGHWYANREAVVIGTISTAVPLAVERLLWYRKRF
ncbi:phage gp6-like head-tail connector protein [Pseudomonas tructae]|uniref:Phage gp6-like head-tail connector protein n=1 Tax=Pseudomonas tructae TaxID=2518644 RepID=A0A411ML09_9PSED|nr:head-tail connector protein [Pseudomonas tructae]QBF27457.1 phage gp6-like head-tail connector protein [Pseudomonas tructae]